MDQFSHDLTLALEETSLLDITLVGRWGQRRRTRSTGNLPCAPQPTEDSSSSPTDVNNEAPAGNIDNLTSNDNALLLDSDETEEVRLPFTSVKRSIRLGTIESDSLNETFSPARFFKANIRRKRKLKRMSIEYDPSVQYDYLESSTFAGPFKKRVLKPDTLRPALFFYGKRKRSNKDRYYDSEQAKLHSSSMPKQNVMSALCNYFEDHGIRTRRLSSAVEIPCDRILPLNKGLISKIEKISKIKMSEQKGNNSLCSVVAQNSEHVMTPISQQVVEIADEFGAHQESMCRKMSNRVKSIKKSKSKLQFEHQFSMESGELCDLLSSSSLSSSDSDYEQTNGTDREGDDELTDWPGNECNIICDSKFDLKRKLTKKSQTLLKSQGCNMSITENDTSMEIQEMQNDLTNAIEIKFQSSQPIEINTSLLLKRDNLAINDVCISSKHIESEMSGETSNTFLSSPPCHGEIREIRAGCRRIKCGRPGFSIKTSVNERLARFLQDLSQSQIRMPDIEIYEHESLFNLAKLYSLHMNIDKGCAVLTKTSNTTQSVNIDEHSFPTHLFLSDYKRRLITKDEGDDSKEFLLPRK